LIVRERRGSKMFYINAASTGISMEPGHVTKQPLCPVPAGMQLVLLLLANRIDLSAGPRI
jgi:hypothetical protein